MSFSYDFTSNPTIAYIRLLIADTDPSCAIFQDEEISAAYQIQASLGFQSSQFYSGLAGNTLPSSPVSYLRVAALLLDSAAASQFRVDTFITQLLDVKLDSGMRLKVSEAFRGQAKAYRDTDDEGSFAVIEQCNNDWSTKQRWWNQIQRQSLGI